MPNFIIESACRWLEDVKSLHYSFTCTRSSIIEDIEVRMIGLDLISSWTPQEEEPNAPWSLTFSYGRALQSATLKVWGIINQGHNKSDLSADGPLISVNIPRVCQPSNLCTRRALTDEKNDNLISFLQVSMIYLFKR